MKKLINAALVPETFGSAVLGAVIGGMAFGAGASGLTPTVVVGSLAGAGACATIFAALRQRAMQGKAFFFEKKKQKIFVRLSRTPQ